MLLVGVLGCIPPPPSKHKIACTGDSLTWTLANPTWVTMLRELVEDRDWAVQDSAMIGATITDQGLYYGSTPPVPFYGGWWIQRIVTSWHPDILIVAFGTNDVRIPGIRAMDIALRLVEQVIALDGQGVHAYVALIPPFFEPAPVSDNALIDQTNMILAFALGSRMMDFHSGFVREDFTADGVHLTPSGHQKRAAIAAVTLERDWE